MFGRFLIFVVGFLLVFSKASAVNLPSWYREEKESNKLYIYGTGSGSTMEKAVESALYDMKSKFIIKNENNEKSIYGAVKSGDNKGYYDNHNLNINLLNFSNYKIEKSEKINGYYYILINIKRNELFNLQKQQLDEIVLDLNRLYLSLNKKNDFAKVNKCNDIFRLIEEIRNKIKIIKLIGSFRDAKYLELCRKIEREYRNIVENLDVKIVFEKQNLMPLMDVVTDNIRANNYIKVNNRSKNVLSISYATEQVKVENYYNVDALFYIKLFDRNDNLVNYSSFNYTFTSTESFENAVENIIEQFKSDLKENRVGVEILG